MIGKAARPDAPGRKAAFQRMERHQQKAAKMQAEFLRDGDAPVWLEGAVAPVHRQDQEMIKRAVKTWARMSPQVAGARGWSISDRASAACISASVIVIRREWPFDPPRS